ncbi:LAMI_0H02498g1_1 [Lachancea mirantina]|uniref:LAMI_0H02498g1_1 n=1 Tax=Lachancea mirantina TaxID=1230905 RepID=A0A1G4KEB9_9SACH|nr:LAMI_0H02498g1_1 [Lachancea mirantina]
MTGQTKEGIIAHMNKSHKLALEDYLYAYGKVPITDKIANVRLLSIDLTHMVIQFNHFDVEFEIEKTVAFEPAIEDWTQARPRLVEMAKVGAKQRGYSHIQINEMSYPKTVREYTILALVFLPLACYYKREFLNYIPVVGPRMNNGALLIGIQVAAFAIHILECIYILKPKLDFYRVPTDFLIEWYLFGMLEGFPAIQRFNKLVESKTD